jgi:hypothetical protein
MSGARRFRRDDKEPTTMKRLLLTAALGALWFAAPQPALAFSEMQQDMWDLQDSVDDLTMMEMDREIERDQRHGYHHTPAPKDDRNCLWGMLFNNKNICL